MNLKHLNEIKPVATSHGVSQKRVLLSQAETETGLTQIAVTKLKAGEVAEEHVHETMEEEFFFMKGVAEVEIDGKAVVCRAGDFLKVSHGVRHRLRAVEDTEMMTIGATIR